MTAPQISVEQRIVLARQMAGIAAYMFQAGSTLTRIMERMITEPEKFGRQIGHLRRFVQDDYPWSQDAVLPILESMEASMGKSWLAKTQRLRNQARIEREDFHRRSAIREQAGIADLCYPESEKAYSDFIAREFHKITEGARKRRKRRQSIPEENTVVAGPWGAA